VLILLGSKNFDVGILIHRYEEDVKVVRRKDEGFGGSLGGTFVE
jgi:hypothetical protein